MSGARAGEAASAIWDCEIPGSGDMGGNKAWRRWSLLKYGTGFGPVLSFSEFGFTVFTSFFELPTVPFGPSECAPGIEQAKQ